jgi:hypothetical protein
MTLKVHDRKVAMIKPESQTHAPINLHKSEVRKFHRKADENYDASAFAAESNNPMHDRAASEVERDMSVTDLYNKRASKFADVQDQSFLGGDVSMSENPMMGGENPMMMQGSNPMLDADAANANENL